MSTLWKASSVAVRKRTRPLKALLSSPYLLQTNKKLQDVSTYEMMSYMQISNCNFLLLPLYYCKHNTCYISDYSWTLTQKLYQVWGMYNNFSVHWSVNLYICISHKVMLENLFRSSKYLPKINKWFIFFFFQGKNKTLKAKTNTRIAETKTAG